MDYRFWSRRRERDLERELEAHLELEAEEQGDLYAARHTLGNATRIKEDVRREWGWTALEQCYQDLRYAFRQMRRSPGFTAVCVLTLALGLGTTTAMFSIVNGVLLAPLKYRDPSRLFLARTVPPPRAHIAGDFPVNAVQFEHWRAYCKSCDGMALAQYLELTLVGAGEPVQLPGLSVSDDFFRTLGVHPQLGRDFHGDDPAKNGWTVILSDALWRGRFGADPAIIGRAVKLNGEPHTIIGIMPPDLHLPRGDQWGGLSGPNKAPLIFRPFLTHIFKGGPLGNLSYNALIRLRPGVSPQLGSAELNSLVADLVRGRTDPFELKIRLVPLQLEMTRNSESALWLLFGTVGVVLLIVCVNVGNLMLVRTSGRYREAGVRLALGAGRRRLFILALEEALALVAIGGALGVAVAWAGLKTFVAVAPATLPRIEDVQIDWRVLAFAAAAMVFSTVIAGLFPAWRLSRIEPMESMRAGGKSATEAAGKLRLRELLVGVEVALSTILLIVGALLVMSFYHVMRVDKGFEVAHIVAQDVSFLNPKYSHGGRQRFVERAVAALAQIPGVEAAAATNRLPLEGDDWLSDLKDPDQPPRPLEQATLVNNRFVTAEFWKALGIPLKRGRYLEDSDKNQPRAVLSERAAQYLWGDEDPIGKHISGAGPTEPKLTVVGVVGEVHGTGLERPASMIIYEHYWRVQPIEMSFVVRTRGDDGSAARQMRAVLAQQDPEMALPPTKTMEQIVEQSVESRRFQMYIAAGFAAAALLLASLGIYGVIAFTVARRTTEIGIRMALGAPSLKLRAMILRQGIMPAVAGVAAGVLAATFLGRVISSQLYGVAPSDPVTIIAVAAILLTVAVCACWFPAQRAARIEPMRALRTD